MSQTMEQTDVASSRESEEPEKKQKSKRPANTAFRQQRLKAWQPILTPKTVLPLFFAIGIVFAPIGGALLYASSKVQEISIDYSLCLRDAPVCQPDEPLDPIPADKVSSHFKKETPSGYEPSWCQTTTTVDYPNASLPSLQLDTPTCRLQFYVPDRLTAPVLLYYRLTNFFQNHRRYVKSFDQQQLEGKYRDRQSISGSDCDPLQIDEETNKPYYPCGLIANSIFNDTFNSPVLLNEAGTGGSNATYAMTNKGIAWSSDADLYGETHYNLTDVVPPRNWRKRYPEYSDSFPFPDLKTDEAFQVWMRTAGLPTFSKLALRNDQDPMEIGRYEIEIFDDFPVNIYDGTKSILLSTRTVMGGRNPFLGIAYIVVGGLCIVLGALFTVTQLFKPRKLGDHSYLSWNTDQPSTATTTGRGPRPGETA